MTTLPPKPLPDPATIPGLSEHIDAAFEEICHQQRLRLLRLARSIQPGLTFEDILNPQTFPVLMADPVFHYEDGYLAGMMAAHTSLRRKVLRPLAEGLPPEEPILPVDSPLRHLTTRLSIDHLVDRTDTQ